MDNKSAARADELFEQHRHEIFRNTDQLFARLMLVQWLASIVAALLISPRTWEGVTSHVHIHVWSAIFIGGAISLFPIWMTRVWPAAAVTRHVIAVAQTLMSALLISLTGGRIETHFHVFGSLVILSFYRDWRVLVPATLVVALDHFLRGVYWPYSVYGVLAASPMRSLEHAGWVIFEDVFLFISCMRSIREMRAIANRTAALEASERSSRQIFEDAPIGMATVDLDHRFMQSNARFCEMLGYTNEELSSKTPREVIASEDFDEEFWYADHHLTDSSGSRLEKRYRRKDGELIWGARTACVIRDENQQPRHFLIMVEDLTEQKRAEKLIRATEERFSQIFRDGPIGMAIVGIDESFVHVNSAFSRMVGYSAAELEAMTTEEITFSEDVEEGRQLAKALLNGKANHTSEKRFVTKEGEVIWTNRTACPIFDEEGRVHQFFIWVDDISERKKRERDLRASREALVSALEANQLIMDNSLDVICTTSADGRFLTVNPACTKLWGYTPSELVGRPFIDFVHAGDRERTQQVTAALLATGQVTDFVNRYVRKDGGVVDVLWSATWSEKDKTIFAVAHDVTERSRNEKALREAKEEADRANAAKSEFLSRMSHELRTPLNAILGFSQLLERQNPTETQRQRIAHVLKAGRHLLDLINEVLDISRIDAGTFQVSLEPVSVPNALREAIELVRPLATDRALTLTADAIPQDDCHVLADQQRLKQVLLNLLSNAIKYTPVGGAIVVAAARNGENQVRFAVQDTGAGISADKLARLFTPFERLGAERSDVEGTGLGLALCQRLVEAMHGSIGVNSEAGRGSTFWVELPYADSPLGAIDERARSSSTAPAESGVARRTLLYIEDNLSNLTLMEQLLADFDDVELLTAMQGGVGLELARRHAPDVILLDLHLPDLPGWKVLDRLRTDEATRDIPVIVISADATSRQIKRLLASGAQRYLTKPIDIAEFTRALEETTSPRERAAA